MVNKVSNIMRRVALYFIAKYVIVSTRRERLVKKKKVLVLRLDGIGDAILWLDAAKEYRNLFPPAQYELTLLCADIWSSIAQELPYFDKVISLSKKLCYNDVRNYYRLLKDVRDACYDTVINSSYSRDFIFEDTIVSVSGAPRRIGFIGDYSNIRPWEKRISNRWYTELIPSSKEKMMELERNAEFMRNLGLPLFKSSVPRLPKIKATPQIPEGKYFVLFPGSSSRGKMWPLDRFAEIAARIYGLTGWNGVICGGPDEKDFGEAIISKSSGCKLKNMCGRTNLPELAETIRNARILISNDTSAIHFAAAVATPSVCIVGGGHFGRFLPYVVEKQQPSMPLPKVAFCEMECYHCNWECSRTIGSDGRFPCILAVSVEQVWAYVLEVIRSD